MVGGYYMPFADIYVVSAHPPLPLHSKVPRPWALDTYSTVIVFLYFYSWLLIWGTEGTLGPSNVHGYFLQ